ncbi:MAG: CocE/NonD family hydrolase [Bacteroidota bacterium]
MNYLRSLLLIFFPVILFSQEIDLKTGYLKYEYEIPMRDGKKLHTAVYVPKDTTTAFPIMLTRTPYTVAPYGDEYLKANGNNYWMAQEKYIMAFQDVRGRFMSEGEYEDIRPNIVEKKTKNDIDESSDTFDTIEWLVKNIKRNNGNIGMIGISYPGFYAAHGLINSHPALKAVSPQAPISDWFIGDDFHHSGAMMLIDGFNFYRSFGKPRPKLTTSWPPGFQYPTEDGYRFLLEAGSLASIKKNYYGDTAKFWNDLFAHPDYDQFWQSRSVSQFMTDVKPAVLVVGGLFDAEDLYGTLKIYKSIEKNNPNNRTSFMMGPWFHGGWVRSDGSRLGHVSFDIKSSEYYDKNIRAFFNHYLKGKGEVHLPEASMFETGSNVWRSYPEWPPKNAVSTKIYLSGKEQLSFEAPKEKSVFDEYVSDPNRPVPYVAEITNGRGREYMTDDQRFAWQRPDVLSYEMPMSEDLTVAGPVTAHLSVSTTGTDADFVVKIIDVFPDSSKNDPANPSHIKMSGYQMLVRGEVMRARFRNSFSKPQALTPNKIETVSFTLPDINHTFKKGHRLMVQIQSSWFPLVDRNPQKFVNIYTAKESDFQKATHRVYRSSQDQSYIEAGVIR